MARTSLPRPLVLLGLVACVVVGLNGCAFMSDEDRDFYGKGWVNPKELDQQPHHAIPNPEAPQESAPATATTVGTGTTHPSSDNDGWTAPPLQ